jgi:hypothetical protein
VARGGFLARIRKTVRNVGRAIGIVRPELPRHPPGPPAPPQPPPEGPGRGAPPRFNDEYQIWRDTAHGNDRRSPGLMGEWWDLYKNSVAPLQMDRDEELEYWEKFLQAFYLTSGERGSLPRDRFYRDLGVRKRDFGMDWQEWRELKRGTP